MTTQAEHRPADTIPLSKTFTATLHKSPLTSADSGWVDYSTRPVSTRRRWRRIRRRPWSRSPSSP